MNLDKQSSTIFGVILIIIGTLLFSIADAFVKWLAATYSASQIGFIRSTMGMSFVGIFVLFSKRVGDLKTTQLKWHAFRGMMASIMILTSFYALGRIPLLEVIAIAHAAPIFVAVIAPFFLDEHVSRQHWTTIMVGFAGVLIILRPSPDHFHIAHLYMALGALAYALLIITARKLAKSETIVSLNFYIYPITIIATATLSLNNWNTPSYFDWLLFVLLAISATLALACYVVAVKYVEATTIAPLDYVSMLWATMIGYFIWRELPDPLTFTGISLIVFSGVYLVTHTKKITDAEVSQSIEH